MSFLLVAGKLRGPFSEINDSRALQPLKRDTLYIPTYVTIKTNPFTGSVSDEADDDDDVHKAYPFKYKFVSSQELNDMILSRRDFYYLPYVRSSTDKFVNIFANGSQKLLYAEYVPLSYNFKNKDLSHVAKIIK